jgi:hypothetical protein
LSNSGHSSAPLWAEPLERCTDQDAQGEGGYDWHNWHKATPALAPDCRIFKNSAALQLDQDRPCEPEQDKASTSVMIKRAITS